jgi:zinc protease
VPSLILLLAPLASAQGTLLPAGIQTTQLENGLTLHVIPTPTPGVVSWQTWVDVGSKNEVMEGTTGLAHLFEHLMFYGSAELPRQPREDELLRLGVTENAWTWMDETVYTAVVPAASLERVVQIEADRFLNFQVSTEQLQRESGAVYGEYRMSRSSAWGMSDEQLYAAAYGTHTYHHPTIGWEADIQAMPTAIQHATEFFEMWYRPESTRIVVSGDLDPAQVQDWVQASWGSWSVETVTYGLPAEPMATEPLRIDVEWSGGPTSPLLMAGYRMPGFDPASTDVAAWAVMEELLTGPTAPLRQKLERETGWALDFGGGDPGFTDPHLFVLTVELSDPTHLAKVEAAITAELQRWATEPNAAELKAAQEHALRAMMLRLDDPVAVSDLVGRMTRGGAPASSVDTFAANYATVDVEAVAAVAQTMLVSSLQATAVLLPAVEPASSQEQP